MISVEDSSVLTAAVADVSRETFERLDAYRDRLLEWNKRINLISPSTTGSLWIRHIVDSAQIVPLVPKNAGLLVDMGSGAGFPGLVISIIARQLMPELQVRLIESDQRKSAFLRSIVRDQDLKASVLIGRLENVPFQNADVITARALAPLADLLRAASLHSRTGSVCFFPKGRKAELEIQEAQRTWKFDVSRIQSVTDDQASILEIGNISHV